MVLVFSSQAQESLADLPDYRAGCEALSQGEFKQAVEYFQKCRELLLSDGEDGLEDELVTQRLLESLVRQGEIRQALQWALGDDPPRLTPTAYYWVAVALQSQDRFAEAADSYQIFLSHTPGAAREVRINRAICLARSGQMEAATGLIEGYESQSAGESLRIAQILAMTSTPSAEILAHLPVLDDAAPDTASLRMPATRIEVAVRARAGDRKGALAAIYRLIDHCQNEDDARQAFLLLEVFLEGSRPAGLTEKFSTWLAEANFPGREACILYRCLLLDSESTRTSTLRDLVKGLTDPALQAEAALRLGQTEEAPVSLPRDLQERLDFVSALTPFRAGDFEEATKKFFSLAEKASGESAARSLFDAAISALRAEDVKRFVQIESELASTHPRSEFLADLRYLASLFYASRGVPEAFSRLNRFVQGYPDHPNNIDAQLTLAELYLNQAPARPHDARILLEGLRSRSMTLSQSERLDYVGLWVEVVDLNKLEILRRATEFAANWPASAHLGEALMILGREQYERKDFTAASEAFSRIANQLPDSPLAESAQFFAAKSLSSSEEAVAAWRVIIEEKGRFAEQASHELGLLWIGMDRFEGAQAVLRQLAEELASDSPLRYAVLADLAHCSYREALASNKDSAKLSEAADHYAELARMPGIPNVWRYNAAVRRGKCLEALGKTSIALEIYQSIVSETHRMTPDDSPPPEELDWVFRAGFTAIEILESEKNWQSAIHVADALAEKSGPRIIEAAQLAERLRLEHWIWE